jgi:hypothetical protein
MVRPYQSSQKVHLATLREFPPARSGKPYFKGRFGDAVVLLFREDAPYRTERGRDYYDWNLVVANDYNVIRAYQDTGPHQEADSPATRIDRRCPTRRGAKTAASAQRAKDAPPSAAATRSSRKHRRR